MSLRVCFISSEYPPDSVGSGIGTYTAITARGLVRAGHDVSVIARAVRGIEATSQEDGVRVHRVLPARVPVLGQLLRRFGGGETFADAYLLARAVASKVADLTLQGGLDILESPEHGARGFVLARNRALVPLVVRCHLPLFLVTEIFGQKLSIGGRIVNGMERTTANRATLTTSPSQALARIVASRFGIPWERIRVVPNCIDHEAFHPAPKAPSGDPTVLYVGKVSPLKGMQVLSAAIPLIVRRIPTVKVIMVGSDHPTAAGTGSSKQEILQRLAEAGLASKVTMLPLTERSNLVRLYQGAHVVVQPSLWENFAYTCLEAMACGVPVVASAVGGLPELIDDGDNGVLVPPNDPVRLADAVATLLEHPERTSEMGRAGRKKVLTHYTLDHVVRATVAVYEEAIMRFAPRAAPVN